MPAQSGDQARGGEGMAAEVAEEVVLHRDLGQAQNLRPGGGEVGLEGCFGGHVATRTRPQRRRCGRRQGCPVHLVGGQQGEHIEDLDEGRDHVGGEPSPQRGVQTQPVAQLGFPRRGMCMVMDRDVADQVLDDTVPLQGRDDRVLHRLVLADDLLDFTQLDPVAPDLHLGVVHQSYSNSPDGVERPGSPVR